MSGISKSSISSTGTTTKPNNVFYVWYTELCRRLNSNPAPVVKPAKPSSNTVLDFAADRLKFEDWNPVINALKQDTSLHVINIRSRIGCYPFLHDVDTAEKARRVKRKYGSLWTDYILNSLVGALAFSVENTQVLTRLELDGLPMFSRYLDGLLNALQKNTTIKLFSLSNCPIKDLGCQSVCASLQLLPNVEILNLSRCELSSESGIHIAKLIKSQQLNRYTTSWHNSLRYSEPDSGNMVGVKRISLNDNPNFGNEGLNHILDELEDDLWIKALDMQKCGITEDISSKLLDILKYNRSLEIADFRQNELLSPNTIDEILNILKEKQVLGAEPQYQWCETVLSLDNIRPGSSQYSFPSTNQLYSNCNRLRPVTNVKLNTLPPYSFDKNLKKTKTTINVISRVVNDTLQQHARSEESKQKMMDLNMRLAKERVKRREIEKENEELKKQLFKSNTISEGMQNMTLQKVMQVFGKLNPNTKLIVEQPYRIANGVCKNGFKKTCPNTKESENNLAQNEVKNKNGFTKNNTTQINIGENYFFNGNKFSGSKHNTTPRSVEPIGANKNLVKSSKIVNLSPKENKNAKNGCVKTGAGSAKLAKGVIKATGIVNGLNGFNGVTTVNGVNGINGVNKANEINGINGVNEVNRVNIGTGVKRVNSVIGVNELNGTVLNGKTGFEKINMNNFAIDVVSSACNIFQKLMLTKKEEEVQSDEENENLIKCYVKGGTLSPVYENGKKYLTKENNNIPERSESQISLYKYMEELKNDTTGITVKKKISSTTKYNMKRKNGVK